MKVKFKPVTISITKDEFNYIHLAVSEYLEFSGGSYGGLVETSFESFQKKYWRAVHTQQRRDVIKKALKEARKSQS